MAAGVVADDAGVAGKQVDLLVPHVVVGAQGVGEDDRGRVGGRFGRSDDLVVHGDGGHDATRSKMAAKP